MTIKRFIFKLIIFLIPFIVGILFYLMADPFKVVKKYDSYYVPGKTNSITLNKDYVSTQNWKNHYPKFKYDSYIFGNSRSMFYQISDWSLFINTPELKCYHFDASGESLYGIEKKFQFLFQQNINIKNALLVIDEAVLNQIVNSEGHIFIKSPELSNQFKFVFQFEFLKAFFDFKFFRAYLDFRINGQIKNYMKENYLLDDIQFDYKYETNELKFSALEEIISKQPEEYYSKNSDKFYKRNQSITKISPIRIGHGQEELLRNIQSICLSNNTKLKIVISPLYDQVLLNPADLKKLKEIFGEKNVYNFSGINKYTQNLENYYETSHYRPHVSKKIMEFIYNN